MKRRNSTTTYQVSYQVGFPKGKSTITNIFFPCTLENYFFFERDALLCGGGGGSHNTYVLIVTILKNCCTISNLLERFPTWWFSIFAHEGYLKSFENIPWSIKSEGLKALVMFS